MLAARESTLSATFKPGLGFSSHEIAISFPPGVQNLPLQPLFGGIDYPGLHEMQGKSLTNLKRSINACSI
jgi:hypothetical protein